MHGGAARRCWELTNMSVVRARERGVGTQLLDVADVKDDAPTETCGRVKQLTFHPRSHVCRFSEPGRVSVKFDTFPIFDSQVGFSDGTATVAKTLMLVSHVFSYLRKSNLLIESVCGLAEEYERDWWVFTQEAFDRGKGRHSEDL